MAVVEVDCHGPGWDRLEIMASYSDCSRKAFVEVVSRMRHKVLAGVGAVVEVPVVPVVPVVPAAGGCCTTSALAQAFVVELGKDSSSQMLTLVHWQKDE